MSLLKWKEMAEKRLKVGQNVNACETDNKTKQK